MTPPVWQIQWYYTNNDALIWNEGNKNLMAAAAVGCCLMHPDFQHLPFNVSHLHSIYICVRMRWKKHNDGVVSTSKIIANTASSVSSHWRMSSTWPSSRIPVRNTDWRSVIGIWFHLLRKGYAILPVNADVVSILQISSLASAFAKTIFVFETV